MLESSEEKPEKGTAIGVKRRENFEDEEIKPAQYSRNVEWKMSREKALLLDQ